MISTTEDVCSGMSGRIVRQSSQCITIETTRMMNGHEMLAARCSIIITKHQVNLCVAKIFREYQQVCKMLAQSSLFVSASGAWFLVFKIAAQWFIIVRKYKRWWCQVSCVQQVDNRLARDRLEQILTDICWHLQSIAYLSAIVGHV